MGRQYLYFLWKVDDFTCWIGWHVIKQLIAHSKKDFVKILYEENEVSNDEKKAIELLHQIKTQIEKLESQRMSRYPFVHIPDVKVLYDLVKSLKELLEKEAKLEASLAQLLEDLQNTL